MNIRILVSVLWVAATLCVSVPSYAADSIGVVGSLQGSASAVGAAGTRDLKVGDKIFLDEEVATNAGSKLQLMLNDRSTITLNANSKVKVREFAYDQTADSGSMAMEGVKGAFRFIGGALSKQQPVTIKTPVSSIGIRGGIADTHIGPNGQTDAIFLYGDALTMTNQNGQTVEITQPGQGLTMNTPNDLPTFTPPNVVQQHLGSFGGAPSGAPSGNNAGGTNDGAGQPPAQNDGENAEGGNESSDNRSSEQKANERRRFGSISDGKPNLQPNGQGTNPSGTQTNQLAGQTTNTASTTQLSNTGAANAASGTPPEFKGFYADTTLHSGATQKERGTVNLTRSGDQLFISATEILPNTGAVHNGKMPQVTSAGYNLLGTAFTLSPGDTDNFTGFAYATPGLNSFYYHLNGVANTNSSNFFFGRQIPLASVQTAMNNTVTLSTSQGTEGINYYRFAPDLLVYDGTSTTPLGFFDYGLKDINPGVTGDNGRPAPFGIAVDWANKTFISGKIHWNNSGGLSRDIAIAFGKVGNGTSASSQFSGVVFDQLIDASDVNNSDTRTGTINTANGSLYSNANNQIESFMVQGTGTDGSTILTPALRINASDLPAPISDTRTTENLKGFAAGFVVQNVGGSSTVQNIWNTHSNGVTVTTNDTGNSVSAQLNLFEKGTPGNTTDVYLGGANEANAYLSNNLYASQQSSVTHTGAYAGTYTDTNGYIAAAGAISDVSNQCSSCNFVHWGVWAGEVNRGTAMAPIIDTANAVPYVAGTVTQNASATITPQNFGAVTYNGAMYGNEYNPATMTLSNVEGTFSSGVNLDTRTVNSFTASVGSLSFNDTGAASIAASGPANFSMNVTGAAGLTGVLNGALYGPAAENMAGNYSVAQPSGQMVQGSGVYLGNR